MTLTRAAFAAALLRAGMTGAEIEAALREAFVPATQPPAPADKAGANTVRRRARRGKGKGSAPESAPTTAISESPRSPKERGHDHSATLAKLQKDHGKLFHPSDQAGRLGGVTGSSIKRALHALAAGETLIHLSRKGQPREAVTVTAPIAALLRREARLRRDARLAAGADTDFWEGVPGI